MGENLWNGSRKIVNIRNPFDTEVSEYYYIFHKKSPDKRPSFADWIGSKSLSNRRPWFRDMDDTWDVIRYESLNSDIAAVLTSLGMATPSSIPAYKSGLRPDDARDYRAMYTAETRAKVTALHRDYIERFDYEF